MLVFRKSYAVLALLGVSALVLAGCQRNPLVVKRSACPAVAVPIYANDMTLFYPGTAPDTGNVDMTATITNLRGICNEAETQLGSNVSYQVVARRSNVSGARTITVPVFASVVQGGNLLVSKQISSITLVFPAGQARAVSAGAARATVSREAASLPVNILKKISKKRRAGDPDAAVDPMADPQVRAAMRAASFEVLVGFQLTEQQLAYNVTK